MRFFVPSFTSFKEGVQHNSLLGQSLWGLRLCEHQEIEAESGRTHFHQFLTCARYYYSPPCHASHSVIIAPAPRYRLETCNILGRAVKPDINTLKERRRWAEGTKFLTCAVSRWAAMHRPPRRPPDHRSGTVLYLEIKMKTAGTFKFTKHFATL